jgi:uncharacterized protein YndB with AHSA1/START domain
MKEFHGRASTRVNAQPQAVFDFITDVGRLPEWNEEVEAVQDQPEVLAPGTQWTVTMHPPHMPSWGSVSRVDELDRAQLRFAYETRNTDGNPSYAKWAWQMVLGGDGTEVTVTWDVFLRTFDRRVLAGPLRKHQLCKEVAASLATHVGSTTE